MKKCFKSSVTCVDVINWYQHCSDQTSVLASRLLRSLPTLSLCLSHTLPIFFLFPFPSLCLSPSLALCLPPLFLPPLSLVCMQQSPYWKSLYLWPAQKTRLIPMYPTSRPMCHHCPIRPLWSPLLLFPGPTPSFQTTATFDMAIRVPMLFII